MHRLIQRAPGRTQRADQKAQIKANQHHEQNTKHDPPDHRIGGFGARLCQIPAPNGPRNKGRCRNRHAYAKRRCEEQNRACIANSRRQLCVTKPGDENDVDEIDQKQHHQANR